MLRFTQIVERARPVRAPELIRQHTLRNNREHPPQFYEALGSLMQQSNQNQRLTTIIVRRSLAHILLKKAAINHNKMRMSQK